MKKTKKALLLSLCAVMLVTASVLGTMAYLTSTDEVVNTFTVGNVAITLDETDVDNSTPGENDRDQANEYKLMPGKEYVKDPILMPQREIDLAMWYFAGGKALVNYEGRFSYRDDLALNMTCQQLGVSKSAAVIRLRQLGYIEDRPYSEYVNPLEVWA